MIDKDKTKLLLLDAASLAARAGDEEAAFILRDQVATIELSPIADKEEIIAVYASVLDNADAKSMKHLSNAIGLMHSRSQNDLARAILYMIRVLDIHFPPSSE